MKTLSALLVGLSILFLSSTSFGQTESKTVTAIIEEGMTGQVYYGRITYKMEKSSSTGKSTPVGVSYSFSSVDGCESGVFSGYGANSGIPMEVNRQVNGKMYKYRIDLPCQAAYFNP
jgi:hypothetical protein